MTSHSMTAKQLAEKTSDAYSADRYSNWTGVARALKTRGYTDQEAEAIMRSKWTRWAGDASGKPYGRVTSVDLLAFMDDPRNHCTREAVAELVKGTFYG